MTRGSLTPSQAFQLMQIATAREMAALANVARIENKKNELESYVEGIRQRLPTDAAELSGFGLAQWERWREEELVRVQYRFMHLELDLQQERLHAIRRTAEKSVCDQLYQEAKKSQSRKIEEKRSEA